MNQELQNYVDKWVQERTDANSAQELLQKKAKTSIGVWIGIVLLSILMYVFLGAYVGLIYIVVLVGIIVMRFYAAMKQVKSSKYRKVHTYPCNLSERDEMAIRNFLEGCTGLLSSEFGRWGVDEARKAFHTNSYQYIRGTFRDKMKVFIFFEDKGFRVTVLKRGEPEGLRFITALDMAEEYDYSGILDPVLSGVLNYYFLHISDANN